jgi:hypothetical protein
MGYTPIRFHYFAYSGPQLSAVRDEVVVRIDDQQSGRLPSIRQICHRSVSFAIPVGRDVDLLHPRVAVADDATDDTKAQTEGAVG